MNLNRYKTIYPNIGVFSLFLGAALVIYLLPGLGYFTKVPGDLGDARFNSVILEHIYQWIKGNEPSLWSPRFFYPYENVLGFSDNHFGSVIFYIFFRFLGFGRELAFDGWFFVGNCLNFIGGYYCLRRLGFSSMASAAGAFVFAFSLPGLCKEGHAQLLYRFPVPLAFLGLWGFFNEKKIQGIYVAAFWTAVQFYCSIYLGVFLVYLLLAVSLVYLIIDYKKDRCFEFWATLRSEGFRKLILSVMVTLVCILSTAWLLYQYKIISDYYGLTRSWNEIASMLPRLSSYFLADRAELSGWLGNLVSGIPMRHEHQMFFGFGVWAIFIYGSFALIKGQQSYQMLGKICLFSLSLLILATLHINGLTVYKVIAFIPGLDAVRAVSRIVLVMMFPVAVVAAIGCQHMLNLSNNKNKFIRISIIVGTLALLGGETLFYQPMNTPISFWKDRKEAAKKLLPEQLPAMPILFLTKKGAEPFYLAELDGMILAQDMELPTLNGYSGHFPIGFQTPPHPCFSPIVRIMGYANFHDLHRERSEELLSRIVKLDFEPCNQSINAFFTGDIPAAQVK